MAVETAPVTKNQELTVTITDLTYEGMGVAKVGDFPLFVAAALPGEEALIHVVKLQKHFGFARVVKLLKTSPDRVAPRDHAYAQTGIAPLQHLAYPAQLKFKQHQLENVFEKQHLAITVKPTLGMATPSGYRNKAQIPVRLVNGELTTGFYKQRSHDLIPLEDFYIQDPAIDAAIIVVRDLLRQYGLTAYDERTNTGLVRHIMVRRGYYSHELMIVLVVTSWSVPHLDTIAQALAKQLPELASFMLNLNDQRTNVVLGRKSRVVSGNDYLTDQLLGNTFHISAPSFYQVNPQQTEVLYGQAIAAAGLTGSETVIDAYSGIGTISLALAKHAKQVYGVEVVPSAVADAKKNAQLNGLDNVTFTLGKAEEVMQTWREQALPVDALVVDPPRKGLAPEFIAATGVLLPPRIVYVSCNPATLARDIAALTEFGYSATTTQPVDMFPQTTHIESVTVLTLTR
ncbi:23S rRNA (uracil(1939)-C(5))-methyltransferase RlmD [Lacticaseibacillus nasuensis]|uniref:TrmA family tRNA (Uracil-5-)-methyltransferase n=1 Tax=Lacticaseibacillus nasuensis JCM 17158 TaxID=1291734 RepID=A0A0R1JR74_9LACO|nr:23S rRNA (uracil(1939)-C(5))-methyltransferase RlmD [Lacticaseibacillus nasuensis]KRK71715.1 TrmA family tRNA (uracil-5-)-methyltransferase [Lacticaseibacillus nasuensis JCM 17158]